MTGGAQPYAVSLANGIGIKKSSEAINLMSLALLGIFISLIFLITFAYRGYTVIVIAPIAASIAVLLSGAPLLASYTQIFMPALAKFIALFFPLFILGAAFGKLMAQSGYANGLATWAARALGSKRAILVTVLTTAVLTYGGVSAWVVVFAMFPIAMSLFQEANITRRLIPAAIALGIFTFATAALPGSPQIHNAITAKYFGTNTFAAPGLGLLGAAVLFGIGMLWLGWRQRQLASAGETFWDPTHMEKKEGRKLGRDLLEHPGAQSPDAGTAPASTPTGWVSFIPVLVVVAINALCTYVWFPALDLSYLAESKFGATDLKGVVGIWSVSVAMIAGIAAIFAMRPDTFKTYVDGLMEGAKEAVLPVLNTANEVGYGAVIASLAVFAVIRDGIFSLSHNALWDSVISTATISGITGSASGGLAITLNTFGTQLAEMAQQQGISLELMHRATAMASISFDSLPHNGAIITLLLVCGLTHRESYKDIFVVTVVAPVIGVLLVSGVGLAFGGF